MCLAFEKEKPPFHLERGLNCDVYYALPAFNARHVNINLEFVIGQGKGIEHADRLLCLGLLGHSHKSEAF